jgi:hypothetical protein
VRSAKLCGHPHLPALREPFFLVATMICEHLRPLEDAIRAAGIAETFRGQPWTTNCREWVYFDCYLEVEKIRQQFDLSACVVDHLNDDPKSGRESGVVCTECHDGIVGLNKADASGKRVFP